LTFEITPARLRDLSALKKFEDEVFMKDAWPVFDILGILLFQGGIHLKAQAADKIIGFISVEENLFDIVAWVSMVGVAPGYRRQGVGKALLNAVENQTRRAIIQLCVRKSNQTAINLYEKMGYQKIDTRENYYADNEAAFVMRKNLKPSVDPLR
jgi:ribosomal-protein-alanine acetyltransferase